MSRRSHHQNSMASNGMLRRINLKTDHGRVVWAKMSKTSRSWPALVISNEILDLSFEEKDKKTLVFWIGEDSFSILNNYLIFDFYGNFGSHVGQPSSKLIDNIKQAVEITTNQFNFNIPETYKTPKQILSWATNNLHEMTKNLTGHRRNETYFIPSGTVQIIKKVNANIEKNKILSNINNERNKKNEGNQVQNLKRKLPYCISCHECVKKKKTFNHPIFIGKNCENCHENAANILLPTAKDKSNNGCCICFNDGQSNELILCDNCVRVYCSNCLSTYYTNNGLNKIKKTNPWKCMACVGSTNDVLVSRTIDEQLHHLFSLFPGEVWCNLNKIGEFSKKEKIQVISLNDDPENVVNTVLSGLHYPFKLVNYFSIINGLDLNKSTDENSRIKLLMQCNPNKGNTLEIFMDFFFKKNTIQLKFPGNKLFWVFETSASIKYEEQKLISRFCGKKPILTSMYSTNIQQRGRFIWTNITIYDKNIASLKKYNIFLRKINLNHQNDQDESKSLCYDSIRVILTSLIHNNLG